MNASLQWGVPFSVPIRSWCPGTGFKRIVQGRVSNVIGIVADCFVRNRKDHFEHLFHGVTSSQECADLSFFHAG